MRVLVVDDHDAERVSLVEMLRAHAYDAVAARDGMEALELAERNAPDVVLSDVLMPKMDGYQLLRAWREESRLSSIPFILYSATYCEPDDRVLARHLGADALLPKPASPEELLRTIGEVIDRRTVRQPDQAPDIAVRKEFDAQLVERMEDRNLALRATNERLRDALDVLNEQIQAKERVIAERDASVVATEVVEDELRQTQEQLHALVTASPLAIIGRDIDGHINLWNPAAEALFGYAEDEIIGTTMGFEPPGREEEFEALRKAMCAGMRYTGIEAVRQRKDGSQVDVSISSAPLYDSEGNPSGWASFISDITDRLLIQRRLQEGAEQSRRVMESTILALGKIVETRDPYTAGHQEAVSKLAVAIAREMGLPAERVEGIRLAALMHDIGKLYVPAEILNKPGHLSDVEMSIIRIHPEIGGDILGVIEFPWPLAEIVLQHQERLDGQGYPRGLRDGQILLEARILSVADVVEAMSHHRPYKRSPGVERALTEIETNRGKLYDADAVDACLRLFREQGFTLEEQPAEAAAQSG